jgi:hypothetical protein
MWLNLSVLGNSDNWTFVMAGMLFDDAARPFDQGGIRQVRPTGGDWVGGGADGPYNSNVYDLAFYPDTPTQSTDLSNYSDGQFVNLTRGVQVDFGAQYHRLVFAAPITHTYAVAATSSATSLEANETATITATFTDKGVGVEGAQVSITFSPSAAGTLVGSTVDTTDEDGLATFTFRAGTVSANTTVTFTITAANGTAPSVTDTVTLTVVAPEVTPPPPPPAGIDPLVLGVGIGAVVLILIAVAAVLFLRRKKGPGGEPKEGEGGGTPPT